MSRPSPETSVADLVIEQPGRARVFERLDIDYCCGGDHSLADACQKKGIRPEVVVEMLDAESTSDANGAEPDWYGASLGDLIDHIVSTHHDFLRRELPRLAPLLTRVTHAHGGSVPWLEPLHEVFQTLKQDLEAHMEAEEERVFPQIRAIDTDGSSDRALDVAMIDEMIDEHDDAGDALGALRDLSSGFTPPDHACPKFRAALHGLQEMDIDMRRHMHKENNILFPRARTLA